MEPTTQTTRRRRLSIPVLLGWTARIARQRPSEPRDEPRTVPSRAAPPRLHRRWRFLRELRVFVSSPGDMSAEREVVETLVDEIGRTPQIAARFALRAQRWEKDVPSMLGDTPQAVVNRFQGAAADADIVVVLIGRRLGTSLHDPDSGRPYASGTENELDTAYRSYRRKGRPLLLVYRAVNEQAPHNGTTRPDEAERVRTFWSGFLQRYQGIDPKTFSSAAVLRDLLRRDLSLVIDAVDAGSRRRKLTWLVAGSVIGIALGWVTHLGYQQRQARRAVDQIVETALENKVPEGGLELVWDQVTDELVALGPAAVRPILGWLANKRIHTGDGGDLRADQSPTRALVAALVEQGARGERDAVCEGLFKVLASGAAARRYPKSTHRIVIRDGIARVNCPGAGPALCGYLGHVRPDTFAPPSEVLVDLREAASPPLGTEEAARCMAVRQ